MWIRTLSPYQLLPPMTHNHYSKLFSTISMFPFPLSLLLCPTKPKQCTSNWRKSGRIYLMLILNISSTCLHLTNIFWDMLMKPLITSHHFSRTTTTILELQTPQPTSSLLSLPRNISLLIPGQKNPLLPLILTLTLDLHPSWAFL